MWLRREVVKNATTWVGRDVMKKVTAAAWLGKEVIKKVLVTTWL
jgi:hypothetical protein